METQVSLLGSQHPATFTYPEPDEYNPQTFILFNRRKGKI